MKKISITRSETWILDDFENIHYILDETIKEYLTDEDVIINIQVVTGDDGLSRFWIYSYEK